MPALICAWRDGIWPCPACSTWPITTCCDLLGRDVGALERGLDGDAAELGGRQGGEAAAELADGRAGGAEDHGVGHGEDSSIARLRMDVRATTDAPRRHGRRHDRRRGLRGRGRSPTTRRRRAAGAASTPARPSRGFRKLARHARRRASATSLAGLGKRDEFDPERARVAAAAVARPRARARRARRCAGSSRTTSPTPHAARSSRARCWRAYAFREYKTGADDDDAARAPLIVSAHHDVAGAGRAAPRRSAEAGQRRPRPAEPPGQRPDADARWPSARASSPPSTSADGRGRWAARRSRRPGMGAFAGVAQGTRRGAAADHAPLRAGRTSTGPVLGFVGKAVTFDSGGISIKPGDEDERDEVRHVGRRRRARGASARSRGSGCRCGVVAVIGATENLPSRPRDASPATSCAPSTGTTIEVINTDAEGRLVLADCLAHAVEQGAERLVDLATLTGAIVDRARARPTPACWATTTTWASEVDGGRRGAPASSSGGCRCTPSTPS